MVQLYLFIITATGAAAAALPDYVALSNEELGAIGDGGATVTLLGEGGEPLIVMTSYQLRAVLGEDGNRVAPPKTMKIPYGGVERPVRRVKVGSPTATATKLWNMLSEIPGVKAAIQKIFTEGIAGAVIPGGSAPGEAPAANALPATA